MTTVTSPDGFVTISVVDDSVVCVFGTDPNRGQPRKMCDRRFKYDNREWNIIRVYDPYIANGHILYIAVATSHDRIAAFGMDNAPPSPHSGIILNPDPTLDSILTTGWMPLYAIAGEPIAFDPNSVAYNSATQTLFVEGSGVESKELVGLLLAMQNFAQVAGIPVITGGTPITDVIQAYALDGTTHVYFGSYSKGSGQTTLFRSTGAFECNVEGCPVSRMGLASDCVHIDRILLNTSAGVVELGLPSVIEGVVKNIVITPDITGNIMRVTTCSGGLVCTSSYRISPKPQIVYAYTNPQRYIIEMSGAFTTDVPPHFLADAESMDGVALRDGRHILAMRRPLNTFFNIYKKDGSYSNTVMVPIGGGHEQDPDIKCTRSDEHNIAYGSTLLVKLDYGITLDMPVTSACIGSGGMMVAFSRTLNKISGSRTGMGAFEIEYPNLMSAEQGPVSHFIPNDDDLGGFVWQAHSSLPGTYTVNRIRLDVRDTGPGWVVQKLSGATTIKQGPMDIYTNASGSYLVMYGNIFNNAPTDINIYKFNNLNDLAPTFTWVATFSDGGDDVTDLRAEGDALMFTTAPQLGPLIGSVIQTQSVLLQDIKSSQAQNLWITGSTVGPVTLTQLAVVLVGGDLYVYAQFLFGAPGLYHVGGFPIAMSGPGSRVINLGEVSNNFVSYNPGTGVMSPLNTNFIIFLNTVSWGTSFGDTLANIFFTFGTGPVDLSLITPLGINTYNIVVPTIRGPSTVHVIDTNTLIDNPVALAAGATACVLTTGAPDIELVSFTVV